MSELTQPAAPPEATFPIVGMGASAGGLAAFAAFFSGMPTEGEPGMAFVVVQHLAPDHNSLLTELIQRTTRMPVHEVQDGMVVEVNHVYIIPPNRDMAFLHGVLHLMEPVAPRGHRLPIDYLFRSLAQDQGERAIGVILSGTGSDGTLGTRAIKNGGGMVMAQNAASCEYDGMPRSAVATGLVDYELAPAEMPAQLMAYVNCALSNPARAVTASTPLSEGALQKIFILLRTQTGHDFSQYKPTIIHRRIQRRMAVHQVESLEAYVLYLQQTATEVDALFRDMLIGVTNFFRDPDAFAQLELGVIARLFEGKPAGATIRVWSGACSTGEEAYSIAILLQERMDALQQPFRIQVFATDIDSSSIAVARAGMYPASMADDVTPERLARFFTLEADGNTYRVRKGIRDMLVFSEQDLIKDPPFSKLDLISCRNLLIYLGPELQKRLVSTFHYALNPGGLLFLGTSETAGEFGDLFVPLDRKAKLYQRKDDLQGVQRAAAGRFLASPAFKTLGYRTHAGKPAQPARGALRELTEQSLLHQLETVAALVNSSGDILYLHGRSGIYLEPAQGEAGTSNILRMAREGLRRELTMTLNDVVNARETVAVAGLRVKSNGHYTLLDLKVVPIPQGTAAALESSLYLVILEQAHPMFALSNHVAPPLGSDHSADSGPEAHARIVELKEELREKEDYLHAANKELETSNAELKSTNEEMQAVNEELQSSNEELETSKEELQSINEELSTVNAELQAKMGDFSRANNDMNNLLAGTGIGTIFVDHSLRILRFTPAATRIVNLILSDVGRPVGHIATNLVGYTSLVADAQSVLDTLVPKDIDVQTSTGQHFAMHLLPYRTLENVIEGVVITFVDTTEIARIRATLRANTATSEGTHAAV